MFLIPRRFHGRIERAKVDLRVCRRSLASRLLVAGGMTRSASTVLYNILRLTMDQKWPGDYACGFENGVEALPLAAHTLVKTHDFTAVYRWRAELVVFSNRDVRMGGVSRERMFGEPFSVDWVEQQIRQHQRTKAIGQCVSPMRN
jgi:hypothetical protein